MILRKMKKEKEEHRRQENIQATAADPTLQGEDKIPKESHDNLQELMKMAIEEEERDPEYDTPMRQMARSKINQTLEESTEATMKMLSGLMRGVLEGLGASIRKEREAEASKAGRIEVELTESENEDTAMQVALPMETKEEHPGYPLRHQTFEFHQVFLQRKLKKLIQKS